MTNEIKTFSFDQTGLKQVQDAQKGKNWPVVYLIHDDRNLYIAPANSTTLEE